MEGNRKSDDFELRILALEERINHLLSVAQRLHAAVEKLIKELKAAQTKKKTVRHP